LAVIIGIESYEGISASFAQLWFGLVVYS